MRYYINTAITQCNSKASNMYTLTARTQAQQARTQTALQAQQAHIVAPRIIAYKYKQTRKYYSVLTLACTYAQALQAFNEHFNTCNSFTLVAIYVASAAQIEQMQ
jgi:hypothetical protein